SQRHPRPRRARKRLLRRQRDEQAQPRPRATPTTGRRRSAVLGARSQCSSGPPPLGRWRRRICWSGADRVVQTQPAAQPVVGAHAQCRLERHQGRREGAGAGLVVRVQHALDLRAPPARRGLGRLARVRREDRHVPVAEDQDVSGAGVGRDLARRADGSEAVPRCERRRRVAAHRELPRLVADTKQGGCPPSAEVVYLGAWGAVGVVRSGNAHPQQEGPVLGALVEGESPDLKPELRGETHDGRARRRVGSAPQIAEAGPRKSDLPTLGGYGANGVLDPCGEGGVYSVPANGVSDPCGQGGVKPVPNAGPNLGPAIPAISAKDVVVQARAATLKEVMHHAVTCPEPSAHNEGEYQPRQGVD
ncbi:hypothetical protein QBC33DRAFT_586414, partial [Phialemonium atrogriseum]